VTPLYPQKLALTSPTGGGRSVGIVRSRTKATEFIFSLVEVMFLSFQGQYSTTQNQRDSFMRHYLRQKWTRCLLKSFRTNGKQIGAWG